MLGEDTSVHRTHTALCWIYVESNVYLQMESPTDNIMEKSQTFSGTHATNKHTHFLP